MAFPDFFDDVARIRLFDPLAAFLGAGDGIIEYGYADAVRLAGHSCPTVAGAYLMTLRGLHALWPDDELPQRGSVCVMMSESEDEGVAGVIAAVAGLLTGAAGRGGFKGLGGRFARQNLLRWNVDCGGELALQRLDTGARVALAFDGSAVPPDPRMRSLLPAALAGDAEAGRAFAAVWQDRVRRILIDHGDDPHLVAVRVSA